MAWNYWPSIHNITAGDSGSVKRNALLNLTNNEPDIDELFLYSKHAFEAKYQLLVKKREGTGLKYSNDSKVFIEYSNNIYDIYEYIEEYNPNKKKIMNCIWWYDHWHA